MADDIKEKAKLVLDEQPVPPTGEQKALGEQATPEEIEFSKLKGSSQDRFSGILGQRNKAFEERDEALKRVNEMEGRLRVLETSQTPTAPAFSAKAEELTPDQKQAVNNLRGFGIATQEDLQALQDQLVLDAEYQRLEGRWGNDSKGPVFDRVEVEEHMKKTGIFNPEKAFEDLYRDEIFDLRKKSDTSEVEPSSQTYTEKPTGSGMGKTEPLTVDSLRERLSRPDGMGWWEKNRERILPLMGQLIQ